MASFDSVNYLIRPNKNIERKLVFESLRILEPTLQLKHYQYVGFGSPWFVDFVLAHRYLLIDEMFCIEHNKYAERMEFNKPYECIEVCGDLSTAALQRLNIDSRKSIIWLDYDSGPEGPVLEDIEVVANRAKQGTIFLITLNARRDRLPKKDSDGRWLGSWEHALRFKFKELVPSSLGRNDLSPRGYPKLLSKIVFAHICQCIFKSGRGNKFVPMFNFYYHDGTPMITVGGLLSDDSLTTAYQRSGISDCEWVTGENQLSILAPPLTIKEKLTLDRLLPRAVPPMESEVGFGLSSEQLSAYHKLYRYYPVFGEFQI